MRSSSLFFFGLLLSTTLVGCPGGDDSSNSDGASSSGGTGSSSHNTTGTCTESATALLTLDSKDDIVDIAVSGDTIYLAVVHFNGASTQREILSMPKGGGSTKSIATLDSDGIDALVVDDQYVYSVGGSHLMRTPKAGGTPVLLATMANGNSNYHNVGVDSSRVYFNYNGVNSVDKTSSSVTSDGYTKVATHGVNSLVLSGGTVYFTSDEAVYKAATAGGGSDTVLADGLSNLNALAVCGDQVIFLADSSGSGSNQQLYKVSTSGGSKTALGAEFDNVTDTPVACAGTNVYYSSDYFSVNRIPLAGGKAETISCSTGATTLVADGSNLYWVGYNTNILYSLKQ
jgi:hypothetical protein